VNTYKIGAIANLTGLSTHTIRAWERRYGMELSDRTEGGTRVYPESSLTRLSIIKELLDHGDSISMLSDLSVEALENRLKDHPLVSSLQTRKRPTNSNAHALNIYVIGGAVFSKHSYHLPHLQLQLTVQQQFDKADAGELRHQLQMQAIPPDASILTCDMISSISPDSVTSMVQAFPGMRWIVLYQMASKRELLELHDQGILTLRGPVPEDILAELVASLLRPAGMTREHGCGNQSLQMEIPAPVFSPSELNQLADLPSSIKCECPSHMSGIIHSLNTFEQYCTTCENENQEDAELHADLRRETARARSIMEQVLLRVCRHEGIQLS